MVDLRVPTVRSVFEANPLIRFLGGCASKSNELAGFYLRPLVVLDFQGDFWALCSLGFLQAHFDFGIAAGYVNSGQRVYHGRGNSGAFLGCR